MVGISVVIMVIGENTFDSRMVLILVDVALNTVFGPRVGVLG